MAKKKTGHVAIPFLITLLLGILVIGGVGMYLFSLIGRDDVELKEMPNSITKPTAENNATILFVLDEEGSAGSLPTTFLITRILPEEKKMVMIAFPENMLAVVNGRQDTLAGFYRNSGIQDAKAAIANEAGITADRYVILNSEAFQKICDIFGGVSYKVPAGVKGFNASTTPEHLSPHQMERLITYPFFEFGENDRTSLTSDMIAEMVNYTDTDRVVQYMDSNFKTLINMLNTDITSIDYSNEESALKYIFKYGNYPIAMARLATGELSEKGDVFLLSSNFKSSVADFFDQPEAPEE